MKRRKLNLKQMWNKLRDPDINEMDKSLLFIFELVAIEVFFVCFAYVFSFSWGWGSANFTPYENKDEKDLVSVDVIRKETITDNPADKGRFAHLTKDHKKDKSGLASYSEKKLKYDPNSNHKRSLGDDNGKANGGPVDPTEPPRPGSAGIAPVTVVSQTAAQKMSDDIKKAENFAAEILPNGQVQSLIVDEFIDDGIPVNIESNAGESKVFSSVDELPCFPGGQGAFIKYLNKTLTYPPYARNKKIQGRVLVQFIVEKSGAISNISVAESINPVIDNEAVRVIRRMPKWRPGKEKGKVVRVKVMIPIIFKI